MLAPILVIFSLKALRFLSEFYKIDENETCARITIHMFRHTYSV